MIESPCKRHCCLDQKDICLGCHRSLDEIRQWGQLDSRAKQTILDNARQRKVMQQDPAAQSPLK
jgi:predicted Fe-S protein YdhL (DUF1289 family)